VVDDASRLLKHSGRPEEDCMDLGHYGTIVALVVVLIGVVFFMFKQLKH